MSENLLALLTGTRSKETVGALLAFFTRRASRLRGITDDVRGDLVSEAVLKVLSALERGSVRLKNRSESGAEAYLQTVLKNTLTDFVRRNRIRPVSAEAPNEDTTPAPEQRTLDVADDRVQQRIGEIDLVVVRQQPALASARAQIFAILTGSVGGISAFVPRDLSPADARRAHLRIQQQHSRWRQLMEREVQARRDSGSLDSESADVLLVAIRGFRLRARSSSR